MPEDLKGIPEDKRQLLDDLTKQLIGVSGVVAIALGGSYASRQHHAASDLDIGLYYFEDNPFSVTTIRSIAESFSIGAAPIVTDFYDWGAWVNGGAWIHTAHGKVDFLYRNIDQLQRTILEAQQGICLHDYDQQPTNGFYSVLYLAEIQICIPLYDPDRLIAGLKRQVKIYPTRLKRKIIRDSLWSAEFTLLHAQNFARQGDIYNTTGCLTRVVSNLTQALFAINERYFLREKQVLEQIATFSRLPSGYIEQVERVLACPGSTIQALTTTVSDLEQLWRSIVNLPGVAYEPRFKL
jgi:hypothetical protein